MKTEVEHAQSAFVEKQQQRKERELAKAAFAKTTKSVFTKFKSYNAGKSGVIQQKPIKERINKFIRLGSIRSFPILQPYTAPPQPHSSSTLTYAQFKRMKNEEPKTTETKNEIKNDTAAAAAAAVAVDTHVDTETETDSTLSDTASDGSDGSDVETECEFTAQVTPQELRQVIM
jgi:hypothetical protein